MSHHRLCRNIVALFLIAAVLAPARLAQPARASQPAAPEQAVADAPAITEQAILRAIDGDIDDRFGYQVRIDGQTAVIGAPYDDGPANALAQSGAVYVYGLAADGRWLEQAILRSATPDENDFFGGAVAIDGDTIVVGADYDDGASNGIANAGAAYVFVRDGAGWSQQAVLRALDADPDDLFGGAVAIDGDTIVVGAMQDDGTNDTVAGAGQAYLFARNNGSWSLRKYLGMTNPAPDDAFGKSVAIDGDLIAIGAFRDDGPGNDKPNSGSVTIFRLTANWELETQINSAGAQAMDPGDHFGGSVALDGATLVVGAFGDGGSNNTLANAGAAYVYTYVDAVDIWSAGTALRAANPAANDYFGGAVGIAGDTIVVGTYSDDGPSNTDSDSGAAYVFARQSNQWVAQTALRASNPGDFDWFGESVDVSGGMILVGASLEDGGRNTLEDRGAAYLFFRSTSRAYIPLIRR